jgi:hypothetical protein
MPVLLFFAQVNPQDSSELRLLRPKVLTAAGFLGHSGVMQQASQLLRQAATGQVALAADVTQAVYSLAVGSGDDAAYDTVQQVYEQVGRCKGFHIQVPVMLTRCLTCGSFVLNGGKTQRQRHKDTAQQTYEQVG